MSDSFNDPNAPRFPLYLPPKVVGPSLTSSPNLFNPPAVNPKPPSTLLGSLLQTPPPKPFSFDGLYSLSGLELRRPRIFFSYQHATDQYYYNEFSRISHDTYECIYDNSLDDAIDSEDHHYIRQQIRDEFITGTSCTIVLVGPTTYQRKHVDWEIKATLDKGHGLIGIQLPNVLPNYLGQITAPKRFSDNVNSGYALWQGFTWSGLMANPALLNQLVRTACDRDKSLIVNPHEIKKQNG